MTPERTTGDFGSRLREARERKGVSLRAIADVTRISVGFLEALERSDISRLPGGIFSRAFVRAYAGEVGLDAEAAVEDFVRQFPHETVTVGHPPSARLDDLNASDSDRRAASLRLKMAVFGVAVVLLVVYLWLYARPSVRLGADHAKPAAGAPGALASDH